MTPFRLAILNLIRRPLSSSIAVLGIAVAVATGGVLLKFYLLSQSRFESMATGGQSIVGAKAGGLEILLGALNFEGPVPDYLPMNLYKSLEARQSVKFEDGASSSPSDVEALVPFVWFGATLQDARILGTSRVFIERSTPLESGRWAENAGEVLLGADVEREKKIGDSLVGHPVGGRSPAGPLELKVVGRLAPTGRVWDHAAYTSLETAHRVLSTLDLGPRSIWGANVLHYFVVYHSPQAFQSLRSLIDQRTVGQLVSIEEQKARLAELTSTGRAFGFILCALILFLSSTSVASMMVARFDAMATQLAILRAMGYTRFEISRWLVWEGFLLGVVACLIGGTVDRLVFPWVRELSGLKLPAYIANPDASSLWIWLAALVMTIAAVSLPIFRLYRQDVDAALKA